MTDNNNENKKEEVTVEMLMERMKKYEADSQRGVQKLISEKKEIEDEKNFFKSISDESKKIVSNPEYMLELKLKNPKVADKILSDYYDNMNLTEFKDQFDIKGDYQDLDYMANKMADEKVNKILTESLKSSFLKNVSEDNQSLFNEKFTEITKGNHINKENIEKYLNYAKQLSGVNVEGNNNNDNNSNNGNSGMTEDEIKRKIAEKLGNGGGIGSGGGGVKSKKDLETEAIRKFWKEL